MKSRLLSISAGVAFVLVVGVTACNDPTQTATASAVVADTLTLWALTGTSPSFPSAYLAFRGAVTRADGNFNFDIAFDIDAAKRVVVYPQRLVGVPCIPSAPNCGAALGFKPVGLRRVAVPFDALEIAPAEGYVFDSTFAVAPGEALVDAGAEPGRMPHHSLGRSIHETGRRQHRSRPVARSISAPCTIRTAATAASFPASFRRTEPTCTT